MSTPHRSTGAHPELSPQGVVASSSLRLSLFPPGVAAQSSLVPHARVLLDVDAETFRREKRRHLAMSTDLAGSPPNGVSPAQLEDSNRSVDAQLLAMRALVATMCAGGTSTFVAADGASAHAPALQGTSSHAASPVVLLVPKTHAAPHAAEAQQCGALLAAAVNERAASGSAAAQAASSSPRVVPRLAADALSVSLDCVRAAAPSLQGLLVVAPA